MLRLDIQLTWRLSCVYRPTKLDQVEVEGGCFVPPMPLHLL